MSSLDKTCLDAQLGNLGDETNMLLCPAEMHGYMHGCNCIATFCTKELMQVDKCCHVFKQERAEHSGSTYIWKQQSKEETKIGCMDPKFLCRFT